MSHDDDDDDDIDDNDDQGVPVLPRWDVPAVSRRQHLQQRWLVVCVQKMQRYTLIGLQLQLILLGKYFYATNNPNKYLHYILTQHICVWRL